MQKLVKAREENEQKIPESVSLFRVSSITSLFTKNKGTN